MATHYGGGSLTLAGAAVGQVVSAEINTELDTANAQTIADHWAVPVRIGGRWDGSAEVIFDYVTGMSTLLSTYLFASNPTRSGVTCTLALASTTNAGNLAGTVVITGFRARNSPSDVVRGTLRFVGSGAPSIS